MGDFLQFIGAFATSIIIAAAVYTFTMIALAHSKIRMFAGGLESIFPLVACSVVAAFLSATLVMWGML